MNKPVPSKQKLRKSHEKAETITITKEMKMKMQIDLIVTRHQGLVEFLREKGLVSKTCKVISHVTDEKVLAGRVVAGVLPLSLAVYCATFIEVSLDLPSEMRGKELTCAQVKKYATDVVSYDMDELWPRSLKIELHSEQELTDSAAQFERDRGDIV